MAESFLPPVVVELGGQDTGAIKAIEGLVRALAQVPDAARVAADAMKLVKDAAISMADGMAEPLDSAKTGIRGLASAMRALAKTAQTTDDEGRTAMQQIAASAKDMGASVTEGATAAKTSMAELGATMKTVAGETAAANRETAVTAEESAAAQRVSGDAALSAGRKQAVGAAEGSAALLKYATGLGATAFGVFEVVKSASDFNSQMTKLMTQAGVAKSQFGELSTGVLNLAGQIGYDPQSLAKSLYYVESNFGSMGISSSKALELVKTAAEGAKVGGSDLVETTTALNATVASGIPGVQDYSKAMGALNAIVGTGEMTMEDLVKALGTGVLAVVKGYGLSITDVGVSLATFGDNNIRGAVAATDLRMAVQALAVPAASAKGLFQQWGWSMNHLQQDMQKGGLKLALNDLIQQFRKTGVTASEQGAIITELFGKKAGAGLAVLLGNMDKLNSKYPVMTEQANSFGSAWQTTSHTVSAEFDGLKGSLEALGIKIGTALMPALSKVLGLVRQGVAWVTQHKSAVQALAAVIGGALIAAVWGLVAALGAAVGEITAATWWITGIAAALIYAYTHFKVFRTIVNDVAGFLKTVLVGSFRLVQTVIKDVFSWFHGHSKEFSDAWGAVVKVVQGWAKWFDQNVLAWIRARVAELVDWWKAHSQEISEVWGVVWGIVQTAVKVWWDGYMKPTLTVIAAVWKTVWGVIKDTIKIVWSFISGIVTFYIHLVENTIGLVLDMITGKWGRVWGDLKKLVGTALHDVVSTIGHIASGFGTLLYDAGANIIKGLISGIKSMIGGVGSAIGDVTGFIRSHLPFSPAKRGPLSGSGSPDIAGRTIGEMVADGMLQSTARVSRAGVSLAGAARLAITSSEQGVGGLALTVGGLAGGAAASGSGLPPIIVQVDGKQLFEIIQTQALRYNRRNPTSGLTLVNR